MKKSGYLLTILLQIWKLEWLNFEPSKVKKFYEHSKFLMYSDNLKLILGRIRKIYYFYCKCISINVFLFKL